MASLRMRPLRLTAFSGFKSGGEVRVLLAKIHFVPCYRNGMWSQFAHDIRPVLEELNGSGEPGLECPFYWVSEEQAVRTVFARRFGNSYKFDQAAQFVIV